MKRRMLELAESMCDGVASCEQVAKYTAFVRTTIFVCQEERANGVPIPLTPDGELIVVPPAPEEGKAAA